MTQVWLIDEQGFYLGESKFVEEVTEGMTTTPLLIGYVKPKMSRGRWSEGATKEEIQEWKDSQQNTSPTPPSKTNEELLEEIKETRQLVSDLEIEILMLK